MSGFADLVKGEDESTDEAPVTTWAQIAMADAVAGRDVPAPELLARTDDVCLLYRGRTHWFQGEPETLKSWAAQLAVAQVLLDAGRVLYLDFEDDERGVAARLLALGVPADTITDASRFDYRRPDEPLYGRDGTGLPGSGELAAILAGPPFDLVIIDGVTEAMVTEGLNPMDNTDIARWLRMLPRPLAAAGAAVVALDHVVKSREHQGRFAIGGQHKLAGVTGAVYRFVTRRSLSRPVDGPVTGTVALTVEKDRPGFVRGRALHDGTVAVLEITAYPDDTVTARLLPADQAAEVPEWSICSAVLSHLTIYDGSSLRAIEEAVDGKSTRIRAALKWMAGKAWITVEKVGNAHRHTITQGGRAALKDDQ